MVSRRRAAESARLRARGMSRRLRSRADAFAWLGYGAFLGILFDSTLRSWSPVKFTCSRLTDLTLSVHAMNHGAPPLIGLRPGAGGGFFLAGYGDDVGPFLFLAPLGHLFHISNPYTLYRIEFVALWTLVIVIWPLTFNRLFNSRLAGLVAPVLLLLLVIGDVTATNQYWIPGWTAAACLPLLMLAAKRVGRGIRDRGTWLLIGIAVLLAGVANTMRFGSGYGIALAALVLAVVVAPTWRRRAIAVIGTLLLFWISSTGLIDAANAYRNATYGNRALAQNFTSLYGGTTVSSVSGTTHPFWHTFYIGLGFDPNRYGIYYGDSSAYNYVESVRPRTVFLSPAYSTTLQKRYFHLLSTDPGFVLGTYVHKAGVTLDMGVRDSWPLLILVPCALLAAGRRRELGAWLAMFVPALTVLLAVPIAVAPLQGYQDGFLNAARLLLVILLCWLVAEGELVLAGGRGRRPRWLDRLMGRHISPYLPYSTPGYASVSSSERLTLRNLPELAGNGFHALRRAIPAWLALLTGLLVVLEVGASIGASAVAAREQSSLASPNGRATESLDILSTYGVLRWVASAHGLDPWSAVNGARAVPSRLLSRSPTLVVHTARQRYGYELAGPTLTLPAGTYELFVQGRAARSGVLVVAFDADTNATVATRTYPPGNTFSQGWGLTFTLDTVRTIRFVLANNGGAAVWEIRSIKFGLAPVGGPTDTVVNGPQCAFVPPPPGSNSTPSPTLNPTTGSALVTWTAGHLFKTWTPQSGTRVRQLRGEVVVRTSSHPYAYQLASPVLGLSSGQRILEVTARLGGGGMELIAQVPGAGALIADRVFASGLPRQPPVRLTLPFSVTGSEAVQFVLANFTPGVNPATVWKIKRITLARAK